MRHQRHRRPGGRWLAGAGLAACLVTAGCASDPAAGPSPAAAAGTPPPSPAAVAGSAQASPASPAASPASPAASPAASTGRPAPAGGVGKVLVIMEENHSLQQVFPGGMPYLWSLARRYLYASAWSDVAHPSLPNYLAIFGGSAFNDPQDCAPAAGCDYPGPSVFGQALARGQTARAYEESMPQPCDPGFVGEYDVNHNPWAYFPGEAAACRAGDVPAGLPASGALASDVRAGTLPAVGLLTPNLIHDGHDGTLAQADTWLKGWIPVLTSGPDWHAGRLAIVIVFDEGETTEQVPFVLISPAVSGVTVSKPVSHYALTRLLDGVIGAPPLRHAADAPDLSTLLGVR